ncbi:MAG: DNA mismatch repair protein MutS [Parcubacteria group bacterium Gr01-1014_18]|nr:MAG: DNA mismatch repair protein MutS [Parcubacteria group bacterium Greene0416_36]TSC80726.1 MAG: DNA mismatch repair protein MutS [Parcubacteria group bacterium Gr01-1014_18]TSC98663.1 MAG: DNA mismatch repair protein MutS [Parcubacteria group bacterium Greene1014_20]TSD07177.1 MAG: DNA mismatch repair protein MutS [Parcubacteria group bacterium Greene0714_2]
MSEPTPMLRQYFEIKRQHPDSIVMFRLGDFYEMFGEDAKVASRILGITLTARGRGTENEIAMCGIPQHNITVHVGKLTTAGKSVAICDQTSDPNLPGIVERNVTRVVTPGTTLDSSNLDEKKNNYIVAIIAQKGRYGLALADLGTGHFQATEIDGGEELTQQIQKLRPSEVLHDGEPLSGSFFQKEFHLPDWEGPKTLFAAQFGRPDLSGFGFINMPLAEEAAAILLYYLKNTQKTALSHIDSISRYVWEDKMILDASTIRNLELFENNYDRSRNNTLFSILDFTATSMGARVLRNWITLPLGDKDRIEERSEGVEWLSKNKEARTAVKEHLDKIADIERISGRIGCLRAGPKDLIAMAHSLREIPEIKEILKPSQESANSILNKLEKELDPIEPVGELIAKSIAEEPPALVSDGGVIRNGYNPDLDLLRSISKGGKDWIGEFETREIEKTKISSLKVRYNRVFGYYIEISKTNLDRVPPHYIRRQTLSNAERFTVEELKNYEDKILGAEAKILSLENELWNQIIGQISKYLGEIKKQSHLLAEIDALYSLAECAYQRNYTKPEFVESDEIRIEEGRHPVIETLLPAGTYIPNDTLLNNQTHQFILLTGPNMAGKSSYLRQVALILLLSHIGSFVPAKKAAVSITDRIFTRVGAEDRLSEGQSTFMVEMQEASNIIHNATGNSLILLDELGRGTSTYDGVSLAWAISEYIHNHLKAKTIFATHYHELIEFANSLPRAKNYSVAVSEHKGGVVFLRKIIPGGINKSYGIAVAALAGLPKQILERAHELLADLEGQIHLGSKPKSNQTALPFFAPPPKSDPAVETVLLEIKNIDINQTTPMEAMRKLEEWKNKLTNNKSPLIPL